MGTARPVLPRRHAGLRAGARGSTWPRRPSRPPSPRRPVPPPRTASRRRARPRTTRLSGRPANPVDLFKRSETRVHRAVSARNPGFIAWTNPEGLGLLGLPEDLVDLVDLGQQRVRLGGIGAALGATSAGQLGGLVEQRVQLGVLLEVRRLEVVRPQHPQVVLDQLGPLFLDNNGAGPELGVRV